MQRKKKWEEGRKAAETRALPQIWHPTSWAGSSAAAVRPSRWASAGKYGYGLRGDGNRSFGKKEGDKNMKVCGNQLHKLDINTLSEDVLMHF